MYDLLSTYCRGPLGVGGTYCKRYCLALAAGSRAGSVNCLYRRPPILLPTTRRPNTYLPPNLARHPPTTLTLRPTAEYMVSPSQPFPGSVPLSTKFQTPWWMDGGDKLENTCGFGVRCGRWNCVGCDRIVVTVFGWGQEVAECSHGCGC